MPFLPDAFASLVCAILTAALLCGIAPAKDLSEHAFFKRGEAVAVAGPVWKRHAIDDSSKGADGVKLGDVDGDGDADIVTGWEEGGEVRLYLQPAPEKIREPWPKVTVGHVSAPEDAILADFDGDGKLEVISCTEGKTRTVYLHRHRGAGFDLLSPAAWETSAIPPLRGAQMWMQAVPLGTEPTKPGDLIFGSKGAGATIGRLQPTQSASDPTAWRYQSLREAGWIMSLIAADLDADGDADILFSDRKGSRSGVAWLENPGLTGSKTGDNKWQEHLIGAAGREVMFADLADINGDGLIDVIAAVKPADVFIFIRQPDKDWRAEVVQLAQNGIGDAKAVKGADFNGDGLTDIAFTCENAKGGLAGVVWLEQQTDGPWRQRPLGGPAGIKFDLMQVLDPDRDGDLDLITCEERDQLGVVWYENPHR